MKKRLPIEQLREAGRLAKQMLIDRGILAKESVIDKILKDSKAPTLPGIPSYLPHEWTLKASQRIMRDIVVVWKDKCKNDQKKLQNITEFWKFVIAQLREQEREFGKELTAMSGQVKTMDESMKDVPVLKDIFSPMRKKENINAIQRFLIDSFAVAVVLKQHHNTSEYLNWFIDWTQDMYLLWVQPKKRKDVPRV